MEFALIFFWFGSAIIIGIAANTRGRSGVGWFFLALLISPLLAGLLLLALPRLKAALDEQSQMLFDAMSPEEQQRVIEARNARGTQHKIKTERLAFEHRAACFIAVGLVLMFAVWEGGKYLAMTTPAPIFVQHQR